MRIVSENSYLTDKELIAKYKKLAAQADARIKRIEAKMGQAKYKGIERFAYTEAKHKLENIIGLSDGKPRFNRSIKNLSRGQKELMVGHVEHFLASNTSSLSGYKATWRKALDTFNRNYSTDLSMGEYRELREEEEYEEMIREWQEGEYARDSVTMNDAIEFAIANKHSNEKKSFDEWLESRKKEARMQKVNRIIQQRSYK